ncbi:MAG: HAD family hydrolase [Sphingomonadaceae bacterium]
MSDIKAVVFDVGRVIVQWDLDHLYAKLIADNNERAWFLSHVVTEEWHFQHDAGRPLDDMIAERCAEFPLHAELIRAYATRFNETIPGPVAGTADLIEALAEHKMPLFAITNFGAEFWDQFYPEWPVLHHFRDVVVSGQEKCVKPDPAIFAIACNRFGFAPADMLFIDDNPANIQAATQLGWQTHLFRNAEILQKHLLSLGLPCR